MDLKSFKEGMKVVSKLREWKDILLIKRKVKDQCGKNKTYQV